ncbi:MAG: TerC family protein [Candidatus Melainabacteria bacterium]|jgi:predicted tellurium resistance membrane protein TerC
MNFSEALAWVSQPTLYISLLSLVGMEIVLGIDNIVFISILAGKLPEDKRDYARRVGLALAGVSRLLLLLSISWLMGLTTPLFKIDAIGLSLTGKDLILLAGGLFLIGKSTHEIYEKVEKTQENHLETPTTNSSSSKNASALVNSVILQIFLIDTVFSLDSIITAIGMVRQIPIMIISIVLSLIVMFVAAKPIGEFIDKHPSVKILALSFLLMIGTMLTAEAFHLEIPKGYIYFAMFYALLVESINIRFRSKKR